VLPTTRYAKSGEVHVAYQVFGEGDIDLVYVPGFISNIEHYWEEPGYARLLRGLARFSRVLMFDKRGTGLSDRVERLPTMDERMDDVRAVLDAEGLERAAVMGVSEGGSLATLFAASHPSRCQALVLYGAFAKFSSWFATPQKLAQFFDYVEKQWGSGANVATYAPSRKDDSAFCQWFARRERVGASPAAASALMRMNSEIDITAILPSVRVPTLVIHRTGDLAVDVEGGRQLAKGIPNAKLIELPGNDHLPQVGDVESILGHVAEFLTGAKPTVGDERTLATVLLTDIVGSTQRAEALGDRRWRDLLEAHSDVIRQELRHFRGKEVKSLGDGVLAVFDGPGRAINCSLSIIDSVKRLGIEIRAGLHTGEVELGDTDVRGIAVHVAARVAALAGPSECLVTRTVRDLVAGAEIQFSGRGKQALKGLAEPVDLFRASALPH
jgi:class 3 adenylate cyclase